MSIFKSNLTIFREAVDFAEKVGAPPEQIVGLIKAERDALRAELSKTRADLQHVRDIAFLACAAAGINRLRDLIPWVNSSRKAIADTADAGNG